MQSENLLKNCREITNTFWIGYFSTACKKWRDGIESETRISGLHKGSQKKLGIVSNAGSGNRILHCVQLCDHARCLCGICKL